MRLVGVIERKKKKAMTKRQLMMIMIIAVTTIQMIVMMFSQTTIQMMAMTAKKGLSSDRFHQNKSSLSTCSLSGLSNAFSEGNGHVEASYCQRELCTRKQFFV